MYDDDDNIMNIATYREEQSREVLPFQLMSLLCGACPDWTSYGCSTVVGQDTSRTAPFPRQPAPGSPPEHTNGGILGKHCLLLFV
jgi:hypothetical protein